MNIFGLGLPELIIIAVILLLFFGPKRLPSLFRSIGTSVRELKDGLNTPANESDKSTAEAANDTDTKPTTGA